MPQKMPKLGTSLGFVTAAIYLAIGFIVVIFINFNMRNEGLADARRLAKVVLEQNLAIHAYFTQQLKPNIFSALNERGGNSDFFDPVMMSSTYAVRWIDNYVQQNNSDLKAYRYKSSVVNSRSPQYEADSFEIDYLNRVADQTVPEDWSGIVTLEGEPYFVFLKANMRLEESCMRCHSEPENAPEQLVNMYGSERSFGKKSGQISSALSLRIPLTAAYARANNLSFSISMIYVLLLFAAWALQSFLLRRLVVLPLRTVRDQAKLIASDQLSLGEMIPLPSSEEMNDLASAFNSMSLKLKTHQDELIDLVAERTEELEKTCADLKKSQLLLIQNEKMATIGQLAAGVAHEINNPIGFVKSNLSSLAKYFAKLTAALGACEEIIYRSGSDESKAELKNILRQNKIQQIDKDLPELIDESLDGVNRVGSIVQNLKTFSRIDSQKWCGCSLNESLESTLNIVCNDLKYKAEIHKDYADLPPVECYPQQLSQVFLNLLVNAGHAIEETGNIWLKTWIENDHAYVTITDDGCGMSEETRQKLFEPFYTTKETGKGTGLGMSIVYEIMQKHSGSIDVESSLGQGCKITLCLPVTS